MPFATKVISPIPVISNFRKRVYNCYWTSMQIMHSKKNWQRAGPDTYFPRSIISTETRIQIIATEAYMIWDTHNTVLLFTPTKPDFFIRNTSETIFLEKKVSPQLKIIINIGM
jgi:hypothetical protein